LLVVVGTRLLGQEQKRPTRKEFMRQKLELSKGILEGLTTEDYATITKNARALKSLSTQAQWKSGTLPNAAEYISFTTEFQKISDELASKARDNNLDGATLAYLRLTMNCVQCHKYVRGVTP
jgi:hypothetical protein